MNKDNTNQQTQTDDHPIGRKKAKVIVQFRQYISITKALKSGRSDLCRRPLIFRLPAGEKRDEARECITNVNESKLEIVHFPPLGSIV